jgi:hypothetical protein
MDMAVGNLACYLCETSIEEEVVDFTEMGGWHKFDKLLSLLYGNPMPDDEIEWYVPKLRRAAENLKASVLPFFGAETDIICLEPKA